MPTVLTVIAIVAFVLLAILLAGGYYMFSFVLVRPKKQKPYVETEQIYIERAEKRKRDGASLFARPHDDAEVTTPDGLTLRASYFPSGTGSKRFVLFSHGHKCNGSDEFAHISPFYLDEMKYNVLLPDHRAHGKSDGKYIGFSVLDSKDILLWVDYLTERFGNDIEIIMHGASMGAAAVLLANESDEIQTQVKLIVEDCGFSNAYDELMLNLTNMIKVPLKPLLSAANLYCKMLAHYDLRDSDALKNINKSKNPILIIHGSKDKYVPTYMGKALYDACTAVKKDILIVENAIHVFSFYTSPDAYRAKVKGFIEENIEEETPQ